MENNLVSVCWIIYVIDGPYTRMMPTIYRSKPELRGDQRRERYENVFDAQRAIKNFLGEQIAVRIAA